MTLQERQVVHELQTTADSCLKIPVIAKSPDGYWNDEATPLMFKKKILKGMAYNIR
jgi:hypothetical protein